MDLTELQYLRARYYDPTVGRFISRDPFPAQAADTQTFNRYVYVKNNPTNYVDPSGQFIPVVIALVSVLVGVATAPLHANAPYVGQALPAGPTEHEANIRGALNGALTYSLLSGVNQASATKLVGGGVETAIRPLGFDDGEALWGHFAKHGDEVLVTTATDYNAAAIEFFNRPVGGSLIETTRVLNGDVVRLNVSSLEFGVMRSDGITRTFMQIDPYWLHTNGYESALDYFLAQ
jgi:RHS repeat-associated protein